MLGILRRIFGALFHDRPRPRLLLHLNPSRPTANTVKRQSRCAADISALLDGLPHAKIVRVLDGDTVIVAKGWNQTTIRLDSIDCPEDGQHWGNIAAAGLVKLVRGRSVVLEEHGLDFHGRTLATIMYAIRSRTRGRT